MGGYNQRALEDHFWSKMALVLAGTETLESGRLYEEIHPGYLNVSTGPVYVRRGGSFQTSCRLTPLQPMTLDLDSWLRMTATQELQWVMQSGKGMLKARSTYTQEVTSVVGHKT